MPNMEQIVQLSSVVHKIHNRSLTTDITPHIKKRSGQAEHKFHASTICFTEVICKMIFWENTCLDPISVLPM